MPRDGRDELGPIPADIAACLTPGSERGSRPAVKANVAIASGVLVVVPDAREAAKVTAIPAVLAAARAAKVPYLVVDPVTDVGEVSRWVWALPESSGSLRLMVTGPRGTRWHTGEQTARRLVAAITIRP